MEQYHGTNTITATDISNGMVKVNSGGGELGQGFYTGDLEFEAFNWAWHKYQRNKAVVMLQINDDDLLNLQPLCLDVIMTQKSRRLIRLSRQTRTYLFHENAIWAPVVGKLCHGFNQIKFESEESELLLNGNSVIKHIFR